MAFYSLAEMCRDVKRGTKIPYACILSWAYWKASSMIDLILFRSIKIKNFDVILYQS